MKAALLVTGLGAATGSLMLVGMLTALGAIGPSGSIQPAASPERTVVATATASHSPQLTRVAEGS